MKRTPSCILLHMKAEDDRLTIRQAVAAIGLSDHTLRYYERIGLIHPIDRAENSHRRYSAHDLGWIEFLTKLRAPGMPIKQMLAYAELQRQGDKSLPERLAILEAHRRKVQAHLAELQEHLQLIGGKIEYYRSFLAEKGMDKV